MIKSYPFTIIFCFLFQAIFAQTPCNTTTGMAGIYPCNDYDFMSRIPVSTLATTSGNPEGSDIWGWTDPLDGKEYAIIAMTNSTAFVDVTDPVNPVFLGRIESAAGNNFWRDVKVYNNHAFIVADNVGAHGMQVFDLTILRNGVDPDLTYDGAQVLKYTGDPGDVTIGSCHNIVINESEGIAYLVGCVSANGGGPIFVDITNPASPDTVGNYTAGGYTHDAQVITYNGPDSDYTGKQIFIGSNGNSNKVVILDVTDKNNIISINQFSYPQISYAHQGWFTDDQRYFILGDEGDEQSFGVQTKTVIFDFNDLDADFSNTSLIKTYTGPTNAIDHNGYVKGNKFYLANYSAGLRVLDVPTLVSSNNTNSEIGHFDTYTSSNSASFHGAWSVYPYFASGNIIISDIESGLIIVRQSNTLSTNEFEDPKAFSLSPNPTTSVATIKSPSGKQIKSVSIYNILGQNVYSKNNINKDTFVLPTTDYSKGIYLIKINNTITKKLVLK
ncbi:choice-of-anchor B family protein [Pontimicrobium sp. MEBiC01747]|jgi:choice-of-anchor B domain-containing protein